MRPRSLLSALLLLLVPCLPATTSAQIPNGMQSMQLLSPTVGWAATPNQLFWTANAGTQWRNVTPKPFSRAGISSVSFRDASNGWLLLASGEGETARFQVASTTDAGTTWSIKPVNLPAGLSPTFLNGTGHIFFLDSARGWLNLGVGHSPALRSGVLLTTENGGSTWQKVPNSPGFAGEIRFINTKDGWFAGGPENTRLFVTHDGSNSWQEMSLHAPANLKLAGIPTYELPVFIDRHGVMAVTFSGGEESSPSLVLFETADGGRTWQSKAQATAKQASHEPFSIFDSSLITVAAAGEEQLKTTTIKPDGKTSTILSSGAIPRSFGVLSVSFVSQEQGWVLIANDAKPRPRRLLSTTDGGVTWAEITPGLNSSDPQSTGTEWISQPASESITSSTAPDIAVSFDSTTLAAGSASTHASAHLGFHKACVPTFTSLQSWWARSPFFDIGIYLPGAINSSCGSNSNLTSTWITNVINQGWGLIPIWVGPQAPGTSCSTCSVFSTDPTANSQGVTEAKSASSAASALGLGGTIIYYDLEYYNCSGCGPAVNAFVSGWVSQMHHNRYLAGVYGSPYNAQSDWSNASPLPDDAWIAKYPLSSPYPITIWGLSPLADTAGATQLNNGALASQQRLRQFTPDTNPSYNGVSLGNIDEDIEDAAVAGGNGAKSYTFNISALVGPPAPAQMHTGSTMLGKSLGVTTPIARQLAGTDTCTTAPPGATALLLIPVQVRVVLTLRALTMLGRSSARG